MSSYYRDTVLPHPRGGWRARNQPAASPLSLTPSPPLGALIQELHKSDLASGIEKFSSTSKIQDCKLVNSFNWLDGKDPTIMIPGEWATFGFCKNEWMIDNVLAAGEPPRWTPLSGRKRLAEDSGDYFRDKNAARFPRHPIEPGLLAALASTPSLPQKLDVFACGSTLGNLLRFIRGEDKKFRMLVEIINNTVFFIRRENSPTELIPSVRGYGHTFPESYTTWSYGVKGSASHQRLIEYSFGGLQFLVRYEGDGYIELSKTTPILDTPIKPCPDKSIDVDQLIADLDKSKVHSSTSVGSKDLTILHGGRLIDQTMVFDLKTRSIKRQGEDFLAGELPRLWVAQIPKFILAFHDRGVFELDNSAVRDVKSDVLKWEQAHQFELSFYAALIHRIISLVKSQPEGKLELRHDKSGVLEIRKQLSNVDNALSDEVRASWCGRAKNNSFSKKEKSEYQESLQDDEDDPDHYYDTFDSPTTSDIDDPNDWGVSQDFTACSAHDCGYCGRCPY
jgi:hypothetical protein